MFRVTFLAGVGALALTGAAEAQHRATHAGALAPSLQGRPVVVRIHADWCPACKATDSTAEAIRAKYGSAITFVQFDVTDGKTSAAAATEAKRLGLAQFFEDNKTQTSTIGILNPRTGVVIAKLYADPDLNDYQKAIAETAAQLRRK